MVLKDLKTKRLPKSKYNIAEENLQFLHTWLHTFGIDKFCFSSKDLLQCGEKCRVGFFS